MLPSALKLSLKLQTCFWRVHQRNLRTRPFIPHSLWEVQVEKLLSGHDFVRYWNDTKGMQCLDKNLKVSWSLPLSLRYYCNLVLLYTVVPLFALSQIKLKSKSQFLFAPYILLNSTVRKIIFHYSTLHILFNGLYLTLNILSYTIPARYLVSLRGSKSRIRAVTTTVVMLMAWNQLYTSTSFNIHFSPHWFISRCQTLGSILGTNFLVFRLGRLGSVDGLQQLLPPLATRINTLRAVQIANCCWAYAKNGIRNDELWNEIGLTDAYRSSK